MPKPSFPILGLSYNVKPNGGVANDKTFLSCTEDGDVDLYNEVDVYNPGRQHWLFTKVPGADSDVYHIRPAGNVNSDHTFLSTSDDGETVDLYREDDASGRQRWRLTPNDGGWFQIKVVDGIDDERKILSCTHGGKVDLNYSQDGTGRQQWKLVPEDVEFNELVYDGARAVIAAQPDFIDTDILINRGSVEQQMTAHFGRRAVETSTYQNETSLTFTLSTSMEISAPGAKASISTSITSGNKWTFGKSETREDTRSYDFPVKVEPFKRMRAQMSVAMAKVDIPYVAKGVSKKFNQAVEIKGIWRGVVAGKIDVSFQEEPLDTAVQ